MKKEKDSPSDSVILEKALKEAAEHQKAIGIPDPCATMPIIGSQSA